ncbi:hypothetical protein Agub_g9863 [Astrephomene gubernaculifera]|uniref:Sulfotransferase n=1 Tax=Astrephomene gubernaculifera TaxID=47775 RepID=A0AAD3DYC4_9CHLO|nr:hypothetical protein Agub_g9863 [Astrephomene gubernaculifera]
MTGPCALALVGLALLGLAQPSLSQTAHECQALTDHYLEKHHKEAVPYTGSNMVYFLHVPRTAGRTFHSCLLKTVTHPARRCPKAYDHLRLSNMSMPNCYLLSSHDDFSVVSMLPPDVAVISQLRDPLDRFISAYEFAIEVAARSLRRPKNYRKKVGRIATEDVWPWSYLIPFFQEDMQPKVAAAQAIAQPEEGRWIEVEQDGERWYFNKALNVSRWNLTEEEAAAGGGVLPLLDPYDNQLVMSLKDFAQHPIAAELLHNGATFQVLGITNYSHWGDAGAFRSCLKSYDSLRDQMLRVAQERVRRFSHVGTTDRLFESAASALVSLGYSTSSPAYSGGDDDVAGSGGVRRRAGEGGGGGQGGRGGAGGRAGSGLAAQMQLQAKLVREARQRLQNAQRELADGIKGSLTAEQVDVLRGRVEALRKSLIQAQDKLASLRDQLPQELGGRGQAADKGSEAVDNVFAAQGARRRLMGAEQEVEQQVEQQPLSGGQEEELEAGGQQRRLLATNKISVATSDAFGNPLDLDFKRIPNSNVGNEFMRCASRAQQRAATRREQSLAALCTADGRQVSFSKAARKRIPADVLDLIRSYNTLDTALHRVGLGLLDARLVEQKEQGLYADMPKLPADDAQDSGLGARRANRVVKPRDERVGDELR